MRRSALVLVLLALFGVREAFAQQFGLTELSVDKLQTSPITILVSTKGTPPPVAELEDPNNWRLNMTTAEASPQIDLISEVDTGLATVYPRAGFEAGHVITRPKKIADQPVGLKDWSTISRAVLGAAVEWTFFKPKLAEDDWYHLTAGASYSARVLFAPEPSVEPGVVDGQPTPVTTVEKGTRHFAEASLDWNVMKFTAVSLKYKYGAQPPLFKLADHQWVFGITIKAAKK